jgi:hypothetical protein
MDLADMQPQKRIKEVLMRREPHLADVIWTNAKTQYHQVDAIIRQTLNGW